MEVVKVFTRDGERSIRGLSPTFELQDFTWMYKACWPWKAT
jgi:hypothetical protein